MKIIGIVTIVDNYNFGNRLQNYAIYLFLKKTYGVNAVTLVSHKEGRFEQDSLPVEIKNQVVLGLSHFPGIVEKRFNSRVNRWVNFVNWSRRIPTKHYYNSFDLPEELGKKYDCLFAGSDQIWNYSFSSDRFYNYFLQFAEYDKRASLSASFGVEEIPDEWKQRYIEGLAGMKYISVREEAGAKIVKELTGRDVPVLADPVMMLDREEWLATAEQPRVDCSVPYVLKYYLGEEDDKKIDRWAEQNGYRVYELMKKDKPELYSAGPGEFLTLIDRAALVCSDSFHCIAFSILMKKPFIVYARKGKHNNMSSRMDTLLNKFGFSDRWDTSLAEKDYLDCDFGEVDGRLAAERRIFREYTDTVLNGEKASGVHLAGRNTCTGCTACASICPKHCIGMKEDENGFYYPHVDASKCINCGICEKTCPMLNEVPQKAAIPEAYAAYSLDEDLRADSSSGGVFSELAKTVLEKGGIVYGAAYGENFHVCHRAVDTLEGLKELRGAKYAQSSLGETFTAVKEHLDRKRELLFCGTPCQVAGLRAFLKKDYDNLLCVDFVCHGVPSPMAWGRYVEYRARIDNDGNSPVKINLRDKRSGWSRYQYSNVFQYGKQIEYKETSTQSIYMKLFTRDYISRQSCGNCKFKGYGRSSDITLGDFWGIWDIAPEMDDNRGTSLVLVQSEKGKKIWDDISPYVQVKPVTLEESSLQNPSMLSSSVLRGERDMVLKLIREEGVEKVLPLLSSPASFWKRIGRKVNNVCGVK